MKRRRRGRSRGHGGVEDSTDVNGFIPSVPSLQMAYKQISLRHQILTIHDIVELRGGGGGGEGGGGAEVKMDTKEEKEKELLRCGRAS